MVELRQRHRCSVGPGAKDVEAVGADPPAPQAPNGRQSRHWFTPNALPCKPCRLCRSSGVFAVYPRYGRLGVLLYTELVLLSMRRHPTCYQVVSLY